MLVRCGRSPLTRNIIKRNKENSSSHSNDHFELINKHLGTATTTSEALARLSRPLNVTPSGQSALQRANIFISLQSCNTTTNIINIDNLHLKIQNVQYVQPSWTICECHRVLWRSIKCSFCHITSRDVIQSLTMCWALNTIWSNLYVIQGGCKCN